MGAPTYVRLTVTSYDIQRRDPKKANVFNYIE